jgi:hypothetical protein
VIPLTDTLSGRPSIRDGVVASIILVGEKPQSEHTGGGHAYACVEDIVADVFIWSK